jgi:hypothetical protein
VQTKYQTLAAKIRKALMLYTSYYI